MVFTVLGAVSELERSLTAERVRAGMRNAKAKGRHIGRPPLRRFSDAEVEQIRKARRMEATSIRKLASQFNTTQWMVSQILAQRKVGS
jgi:DNA invertase Pin-like site-specific DNA recombinase